MKRFAAALLLLGVLCGAESAGNGSYCQRGNTPFVQVPLVSPKGHISPIDWSTLQENPGDGVGDSPAAHDHERSRAGSAAR